MTLPPDTIVFPPHSAPLKSETTPQPSVLRIKLHKRGWAPISRSLIDDSRLQFDTRAVASWLLAKPDGWQIRLVSLPYQLQQRTGPGERMGRDRVRRILRELEQAGYLIRARSKTYDGRWMWRVELSDEPSSPTSGHATIDGSAVGGSPVDGSGVHLLNTLNYSRLDQSVPTTTSEGSAAGEANGSSSVADVRYPIFLDGEMLTSARKVMEICPPDQRQAVLDEIGAMHALGKVLRPLGLLKALATKAASGLFVPNYSRSNAPQSAAKTRRDFVVPDSPIGRKSATRSPSPVSKIGLETFARLRRDLKIDSN